MYTHNHVTKRSTEYSHKYHKMLAQDEMVCSNTTTTTCVNNTHVMRTELTDANMCAEINQCTPPMSISKPMSSTSESYSDFNIGRKTFSEQLNDFDESYLNRTLNSIIDSNLISTSNNEAMSFKEQTHSNGEFVVFIFNLNKPF